MALSSHVRTHLSTDLWKACEVNTCCIPFHRLYFMIDGQTGSGKTWTMRGMHALLII